MESDVGGACSPNFAIVVSENLAIACGEIWCQTLMTQAPTLEITILFAEAFLRMFCSFSAYMIPTSIRDGWMYRGL